MARGSYAVELSKALYEQQRGNPPRFLLQELGAHMLFSHIGRHLGLRQVTHQPVRRVGGAKGRCDSYNPVLTVRPGDALPQVAILSELSFVLPTDDRQRGVVPIVHTYDTNGNQTSQLVRKSLQLIDRLVWGPFVPPEYDEPFQANVKDFMDILANPQDDRVQTTLKELHTGQEQYIDTLKAIAETLDIGSPPTDISRSPDFIVPELPPPMFGR